MEKKYKKVFKINLVATNEDLKEKIYLRLLNLDFIEFESSMNIHGYYISEINETINKEIYRMKIISYQTEFRFPNQIPSKVQNNHSSYIAFELSDKESWNQVKDLIPKIAEIKNHPFLLAGNLSEGQEIKVDQKDIDDLVGKYGIQYYKICADTGENIKTSFKDLYEQTILAHP